jgi:ornithine carbamoyltransferase
MAAVEITGALKGRDLLRISDWAADELRTVLDLADELKALQARREPHELLSGRTLGMIFEKHSTRTRVSFEVGMYQLGGQALFLPMGELHLARGESIKDTGLVLSRYVDAVVFRAFDQRSIDELARHAAIPIVNGLSDLAHPCQALADLMTIRERFGRLEGVRIGYFGDGNNVCASLMVAATAFGMDVVVSTPPGFEPSERAVRFARENAVRSGGAVEVVGDPREAARNADVLYTDVWVSMGQEAERDRRLRAFYGYGIDAEKLALAGGDARVMHCLPAHFGEEISEDALYGPHSIVWDQAENRLHAQKALLALIVP